VFTFRNPKYVCTGFDRKNLYFEVSKKTSIFVDLNKFMKKNGLKLFFEGATIIYCPTKKQTEAVAQELKCKYFFPDPRNFVFNVIYCKIKNIILF